MALSLLAWICALFMIGRNIPSLLIKIKSLTDEKERRIILKTPSQIFTYLVLIITALLGLVCGISLLYSDLIFGYYLFIFVSGMIIYSYFIYAGICVENKNWVMFGICIFVIIFTSVLTGIIICNLANDNL